MTLQGGLATAGRATLRRNQQKMTKGSTGNPEAYQLYLKGKYYTNKLTKDGLDKGIDYFNQAIAIDPNYGLAYNGLAYNYINQDGWYMRPDEAGPKAKEAAEKALAIDPTDADAHLALAIESQWYEWNWPVAEREFKRAIELNPNNSEAHGYYSWFLAPMGRGVEALAEARRGQQAAPLSSLGNFFVASVLVFTRQWDPAIEQLHSNIELDPISGSIIAIWAGLTKPREKCGSDCRVPERAGIGQGKYRDLVRPGTRLCVVGEQSRSTQGAGSFERVIGAQLRRALQRGYRLCGPGRKRSGVRLAGSSLPGTFLLSSGLSDHGLTSGWPSRRPALRRTQAARRLPE